MLEWNIVIYDWVRGFLHLNLVVPFQAIGFLPKKKEKTTQIIHHISSSNNINRLNYDFDDGPYNIIYIYYTAR